MPVLPLASMLPTLSVGVSIVPEALIPPAVYMLVALVPVASTLGATTLLPEPVTLTLPVEETAPPTVTLPVVVSVPDEIDPVVVIV